LRDLVHSSASPPDFVSVARPAATAAMAKIQEEVKLDFKDVLIRPKRSTLKSRSQVTLERVFRMKHSGRTLSCVPIIAANMDTVGTFAMAVSLAQHKILTAVHKHYTIAEWGEFMKAHGEALAGYLAVSSGISDDDFAKLSTLLANHPTLVNICLDVANGYSEHFVAFVRRVRAAFPQHTIIAGNVVTGEMVEELILSGADIVKVSKKNRAAMLSMRNGVAQFACNSHFASVDVVLASLLVLCFIRSALVRAPCARRARRPVLATLSFRL
jgi:guanosine monophosphate reductase